MNISAKSNIYEVTASNVLEAFDPFVTGIQRAGDCLAIALSTAPLSPEGKDAIGKSLSSLGYGTSRCAFVIRENDGMRLGAQELLTIIEGLDPLCLIITDEESIRALTQAYRSTLEEGKVNRLLGRPCAPFRNFEAMLESVEGKQKAWVLLKQLPRL